METSELKPAVREYLAVYVAWHRSFDYGERASYAKYLRRMRRNNGYRGCFLVHLRTAYDAGKEW